jgi:Fur family ferric uptake transcriptional regulator
MKSDIEKEALAILDQKGLRKTRPRREILAVLLTASVPLNQEQIAGQIRKSGINKTTIYRTLSSLMDADIVHQAVVRDRIQYYETACRCQKHFCHPHFICEQCSKTICLVQVQIPSVMLPKGYAQHRQQIQIEGLCSDCSKN